MTIRLSKCSIDNNELDAIKSVLSAEFFGTGPKTREFENNLKSFFNNSDYDLVCTNTGTSALQLALQACNFKKGSEILVPTLTYLASYQAITAAGHKPISCDVNEFHGLLSINDAQKRISRKTKAVMLVHYNGYVGNLEEYYRFAKKNNIRVIEDAAHAFGSTYNNKLIGTTGDIACFSFDGIKNITCGEGGMIISKDKKAINNIKDLRLLGVIGDSKKRVMKKRSWDFDVKEQGWRYHMSNVMAAIGLVQLKKFPHFARKRQSLAKYYDQIFINHNNIITLPRNYDKVVPHIYVVIIDSMKKRDDIQSSMLEKGIQVGCHYQPNHLLSYYKSYQKFPLPVSELIWPKLLTLPLHPDISKDEIDYITSELIKLL